MTETTDGVTMPADYGFDAVNDYVHSIDRQYEDLEWLCLGMASHIDKVTKQCAAKFPTGRDNLMIVAAVRYCIGRSTYITGDCADWLIEIWPALSECTRNLIKRDIDRAFARDDEDREAGRDYKALGHDCDRQQWERVRKLWNEKP